MVSDGDPRLQLLRELKSRGYRFNAVTPATHQIVLSRPFSGRASLRDIFGWNRPVKEADLDQEIFALLRDARALSSKDGWLRSDLRVASVGHDLFLHSAFPTAQPDAVFLGPDTYRFVRFVGQQLAGIEPLTRIIDMGAGSGAGGIAASRLAPGAEVTLVDTNAKALELARINAAAASLQVELIQSDRVPAGADLVIANPPYMMDSQGRAYRDGGSLLGGSVALQWTEQALSGLTPGGTMLLYVGAGFVDGRSPLVEALETACRRHGAALAWEELDPDVFGEELEQPAYAQVERIAAIGAVITVPD